MSIEGGPSSNNPIKPEHADFDAEAAFLARFDKWSGEWKGEKEESSEPLPEPAAQAVEPEAKVPVTEKIEDPSQGMNRVVTVDSETSKAVDEIKRSAEAKKAQEKTTASEQPKKPAAEAGVEKKPTVRWKFAREPQPKTLAEQAAMEKRRNWLAAAFAVNKDMPEAGAVKSGIVGIIQNSHEKMKRGNRPATLLDNRQFKDVGYWQRADQMIADFALSNVSLRDLFNRAKTPQELATVKMIGVDLLGPQFRENGQKPWAEMSEQEKRFTRLGELIVLEVERRQFEAQTKPMEKSLAQQRYNRYMDYCRSPDVPQIFRERFLNFAQGLQEKYGVGSRVEKPKTIPASEAKPKPEVKVVKKPEGVAVPKPVAAEPLLPETNVSLRRLGGDYKAMAKFKHELLTKDPNVRETEMAITEDRFDYSDELLHKLSKVGRLEDPVQEKQRLRFLGGLNEHMKYAQSVNSRPGVWDGLFRGVADGVSARWQVFGLRGIFRPFKTGRELRRVRSQVADTFAALRQTEPAKNFLAYHEVELRLANQTEDKAFARDESAAEAILPPALEPTPPTKAPEVWAEADDWGKQYTELAQTKSNEALVKLFKKEKSSTPVPRKKAA